MVKYAATLLAAMLLASLANGDDKTDTAVKVKVALALAGSKKCAASPASAPPPRTVKKDCSCGKDCGCKDGECPGKCPVQPPSILPKKDSGVVTVTYKEGIAPDQNGRLCRWLFPTDNKQAKPIFVGVCDGVR